MSFLVVPTIDVEGVHGDRPFEQFVLGDVGASDDWGVYRMARLFRDFGVQATFFVDVLEYTFWGEDALRRLCERLRELDQDVQLHTHPAWRDDPRDPSWLRQLKREKSWGAQQGDFMHRLSGERQIEVLEHCLELFQRWLGKRPVAHRSGGYSINPDTVRALKAVGIPVDSSMNSVHPNTRVSWASNQIVAQAGLVELPVTVADYCVTIPGLNDGPALCKRLTTDLDSTSLEHFLEFVEQGEGLGLRFMNLFMHSYSLLGFDAFFNTIRAKPSSLAKLEGVLDFLGRRRGVSVLSCSQFWEAYQRDPLQFQGADAVPRIVAPGKLAAMSFAKFRHRVRTFGGRKDDVASSRT